MGLALCCWQGIGQSQSGSVHQTVDKTAKFFARACLNNIIVNFVNFRYLRVYAAEQKFKCVHSVSKMTVPENQVL